MSSKPKAEPAAKEAPATKTRAGLQPPRQDGTPEDAALRLEQAELDEEMQAYFAKCVEKIGFVPNVLTAYAHDLAKLKTFVSFYNELMLGPSGLSKLEREMIAVAVSSINKCFYCLVAHGAAVRQISGDPVLGELMVMNWRAANLPPRHVSMLEFASKLTESPHLIGESDRQALRDAGFGEKDIWDIAAVAGFYNMSNRVASATDMRPNPEYHGSGR